MKDYLKIRTLFQFAAILLLLAMAARAQTYTATDLGTLGNASARVHAVNSQGQAVGAFGHPHGSNTRAFFWSKQGGMRDLGVLAGGDYSVAFGLNDSGQVVGASNTQNTMRAFLWSSSGGLKNLGTLSNANSGAAYAINSSGQIAGVSGNRAVIWNGNAIQDLGTLGGQTSEAHDINSAGQVVGVSAAAAGPRAFLWKEGKMQDLGVLPGDTSSRANHLNDQGMVVGGSEGLQGIRAFVWTAASGMQAIATLPGGNYTEAFGINNLGQVVGLAESSLGPRASLWTSNGSILDLNDLVSGLPSGMVLTGAFAINDKGQIVAFGLVHPNVSKNKEAHLDNHVHAGPTHVFLLTPQTAASSSLGP